MNKVGIYISGLGQSFHNENVEKYAERFRNELHYNEKGRVYELKSEIITYAEKKTAKVVRLVTPSAPEKETVAYTFYEFEYHELLTERFKKQNILLKNLILFGLVFKKSPQLIKRLFVRDNYNRPYLSFYAFFILIIVSLAIIFLIPASVDMVSGFTGGKAIMNGLNLDILKNCPILVNMYKFSVPLTTFILLLVPESK
ncbi:MAG: hypothetical protein Q8K02_06750, partial [Flavobacterium sp.]|nr:hypothetical protein [Flavobacterium sp.]